ncbi:MAG: tetratricopeptide repeat protein [Syntrophales bacterium]|jgi:predicted Zn-dependent protease|nr:hypothetical protein [Syntrophales bacterium]
MTTDHPEKKPFDSLLARTCLSENRLDEAVKMAEVRLVQAPGDVEAILILCQGLLRMGKFERLRDLMNEVDAAIGRFSQVYHQLGTLCEKAGLNKESLNFFQKHNALSEALASCGNRFSQGEAGSRLEKGHEAGDAGGVMPPEFQTVTLADLYAQQGHYDMARKVLEGILTREPSNEQASNKLAELAKRMTGGGGKGVDDSVAVDSSSPNAPVIAELERWLARAIRMRSPAV